MRQKIVYSILVICLLGCSETEYPHKFPIALTDQVTDITQDGAKFSGRIQNLEGFKVSSYGFVWDQSDNPTLNSSRVSIATNVEEGAFSQVIQYDLEEGKNYFVRAFIQTDKVVVYGDKRTFTSKGSLPPVITSFSPAEGLFGTEIIVTGKNFSTKPTGNRVTVGGVEFTIVSTSENELVIVQPETQLCGSFPINIEVAGQIGTSSGEYKLIGPEIESISKTYGRVGDLLTLNGKYFDLADEGMFMYFGVPEWGNSSEVSKISATQIECYVPDYADHTGTLKLFSQIPDSKIFEYPQPFTILNSWQKRYSNTPLEDYQGYASAQMNNVVYVIGGRTLYEYNLSTQIWTKKQDFPGAYRFYGTAFTFNGKLYYGFGAGVYEPYLGTNGQLYNDLWSYDPQTNSWVGFGSTPLSKRYGTVALTINNKVYIGFGGETSSSQVGYSDFWEYNVSANSWTSINTSAIQQGNFAANPLAFTAGNKGYFVGLHIATTPYTAIVWEFDPATGQWTKKSDLNDWVTSGPASGMTNHGLVVCNTNGPTRMWEYDPVADRWIKRQTSHEVAAPLKFGAYHQGKFHVGGSGVWELSFE